MRDGTKEDTTMEAATFHHINHMITSTKITDEIYENYYWVNPYELVWTE